MGIQKDDIRGLIENCRQAVIHVLNYKNIGFEVTKGRSHSREIYWLNSDNISRASTTRTTYHVVPFLALDDIGITYWLAIGIQFDFFKGYYRFHDTSIFIFEGTYNDEKKTPILRAEWGMSDDGLHAQPHWHVYPSYTNKVIAPFISANAPVAADFVPGQGVGHTGISDDWDEKNLAKFHFAMGSFWHRNGPGAHVVDANEDGLVRWIEGCLGYIKTQLHHMAI